MENPLSCDPKIEIPFRGTICDKEEEYTEALDFYFYYPLPSRTPTATSLLLLRNGFPNLNLPQMTRSRKIICQ